MKELLAYLTILAILLFNGCSKIESAMNQEEKVDYTAFLSHLYRDKSLDGEIEYDIRDLDNNSIPELIIARNGVNNITVYSFTDSIIEVGNYNFETGTTRLFNSDNSLYPGIFSYYSGGGLNHYGYLTIKDNKLVYEELWNEDYSGISEELGIERNKIEELSTDKQLIFESRRVYKENKDMSFQKFKKDSIKNIEELIEKYQKASEHNPDIKKEFSFSKGSFNEKDIEKLFKLKKKEIEDLLGTDYEISETGSEGSFTSYKYVIHDIAIFYIMNETEDTSDDYVDFVECGKTVNVYGVHIGMTFEDIKKKFPNATLKKWSPEEDNEIIYNVIEFSKNDLLIKLKVKDEKDPATSMTIYRK